MAKYLTTNSLIESVKRRAMLPSTQNTFKESDFLAFANEEMDNAIVPYVHSFREEYFLVTEDVALTPGKVNYKIPDRAIANKLRDVSFKDVSGNLYEMTRVFIEDESFFQFNSAGSGMITLRCFIVQADEIVFPEGSSPTLATHIRFAYYRQPNSLVSEKDVARVTSINTNTNTITIDSFPERFSGQTKFDITSSKNPFKLIGVEVEPTVLPSSSSLIMTFSQLPEYLSVGDIIALPQETIIPQVPTEVHSLLAQRVAMRCLEALGDTQGLQNAAAKMAEMENKLAGLLDDRVEGAPKKVNNFHSFLRSSRRWNWRW